MWSIILFHGGHYVAIVWREQEKAWFLFDDARVTKIAMRWGEVKRHCMLHGYLPKLLFYRKCRASKLGNIQEEEDMGPLDDLNEANDQYNIEMTDAEDYESPRDVLRQRGLQKFNGWLPHTPLTHRYPPPSTSSLTSENSLASPIPNRGYFGTVKAYHSPPQSPRRRMNDDLRQPLLSDSTSGSDRFASPQRDTADAGAASEEHFTQLRNGASYSPSSFPAYVHRARKELVDWLWALLAMVVHLIYSTFARVRLKFSQPNTQRSHHDSNDVPLLQPHNFAVDGSPQQSDELRSSSPPAMMHQPQTQGTGNSSQGTWLSTSVRGQKTRRQLPDHVLDRLKR